METAIEGWNGETLVLLVSMRGKDDLCQAIAGNGGIPAGKLLNFDLNPFGQTYLWERLVDLLEILAEKAFKSARILLLDLSGSMNSQMPILKRMWAAVPPSGLQVSGVEIMVVTDGHDNQSSGSFAGAQGLLGLLGKATELGWDCGLGQGNLGKLHVTLLDVGNGTVAKELAQKSPDHTFICTHDLDQIASIIRSPRPAVSGLQSADWPSLAKDELDQIMAVEKHLDPGKKVLDLKQILNKALGPNPIPLAQATALNFLKEVLAGKSQKVDRRGQYKAFHSAINSMLYQLADFGIVQASGSPPVWEKGVMSAFIQEQLDAFQVNDPVDQLLSLPLEQAQDQISKLTQSDAHRLCSQLLESLQAAKRIKV